MDIELELVSGTPIKLTLPEAGDFESFYVFSMEYSGNIQFWKLLLRLMAAAGRPVYDIHEALREQGLEVGQVKPSALRQLLNLHGYGFGTISISILNLRTLLSGTGTNCCFSAILAACSWLGITIT
ncbi:MAG: hypothetical protein ACLPWF_33260 [Bryobacteraceae bacterium]|jgi:hypothetical protein